MMPDQVKDRPLKVSNLSVTFPTGEKIELGKNKAEKMDEAMQGPHITCSYCIEKKVISPCYSCQYILEHGSESDRSLLQLSRAANKAAICANQFGISPDQFSKAIQGLNILYRCDTLAKH